MYTIKFSVEFADSSKTFQRNNISRAMVLKMRKALLEKYGTSLISFSVYDKNNHFSKILSYEGR